jgi:hypothetical protein
MSQDNLSAEQVGNAGLDLLMNVLEKIPENSEMLEQTGSVVKAQKLESLLNARGLSVKSDEIVLSSAFTCGDISESPPVTNHREFINEPMKIAQLYDWSVQYATDDKIQKVNASKVKPIVHNIKSSY